MEKETELLYNSCWLQIRAAAIGLLLGGLIVWKTYEVHSTVAAPGVGYFFGGLSLLIGGYFLRVFIAKQPAITLSKSGTDLQHNGLFSWDMVDSFSVIHYTGENNSTDLIFHFRWRADISIPVTMFEKE